MSNANANTVRSFINFTVPVAQNISLVRTQNIDYKEVPIVTYAGTGAGETYTNGSTSTAVLDAAVNAYTSQASSWTTLNKYLIINIANEWGPADSAAWSSAYISAIARMRAAGYLGPLLIDAGGFGQSIGDLLNYSTAVFNSDPQKNVMFSWHIYGNVPTANVAPDLTALAALSASVGMVFIVGEFGPGRDIGPSPTLTTPGLLITAAEANGIGWIAWAWDDNNLAGGGSNDNGFGMTTRGPGIYTQPSDLTTFGQDVVLNPIYGLKALAKPASIF
jgi:mannan endo-1,4-beta-mannosidase